jgi:ABC-type transport system involved in Fe-S cluster assembly fused permease/ATPase subunit
VERFEVGSLQTLRMALRFFWESADAYARRRLLIAFLLVAAGALLTALTPIGLKLVIDSFTSGGDGVHAYLAPVTLVAFYVLGQFLWRCSAEMRLMLHGYAEQRVRRQIGLRLFEHLLRMPLRFHLGRKIGATGETAEQGLRGYQQLLIHVVYTFLPVTIEFCIIVLVLVHFDHQIYLLVVAVASIAYVFAFQRGAVAARNSTDGISSTSIESRGMLMDSLLNQETVKYFDAERIVCQRYDEVLSRTESAWRIFFSKRAANGLMVASIFAISLGFSLIYAARDVMRGAMTVGDFIMVNAYIVRLAQPLEMVGMAIRDLAQSLGFLSGMLRLLQEKPEGATPSVPGEAAPMGGLTFERVSFSYKEERRILTDVSFHLPAGKTLAVVGASGSGKSSLIRLLFRLYEPDSGRILLDGAPMSCMSLSAVRQAIAVVPQDTILFHDTIAHNIGFGRYGATQAEIEEVARLANLHDAIKELPEGYHTLVGERGLQLSGGERQRVAIARAALKRPRIYVFDEATSSLDSRTEREILRNLVEISSRSTTLIIAHRLSTIVHADQIIVLDRGSIVERGRHEELVRRGSYYAALWNAQQVGTHVRDVSDSGGSLRPVHRTQAIPFPDTHDRG